MPGQNSTASNPFQGNTQASAPLYPTGLGQQFFPGTTATASRSAYDSAPLPVAQPVAHGFFTNFRVEKDALLTVLENIANGKIKYSTAMPTDVNVPPSSLEDFCNEAINLGIQLVENHQFAGGDLYRVGTQTKDPKADFIARLKEMRIQFMGDLTFTIAERARLSLKTYEFCRDLTSPYRSTAENAIDVFENAMNPFAVKHPTLTGLMKALKRSCLVLLGLAAGALLGVGPVGLAAIGALGGLYVCSTFFAATRPRVHIDNVTREARKLIAPPRVG